jgi:hypothetical protein
VAQRLSVARLGGFAPAWTHLTGLPKLAGPLQPCPIRVPLSRVPGTLIRDGNLGFADLLVRLETAGGGSAPAMERLIGIEPRGLSWRQILRI